MKGKISKRCISLLLAVLMVLSALPIVTLQVFAATNETGLFDSEIGIHLESQNGICWANGTTAFASAFSTKIMSSYLAETASIQIQNHTNATAKLFFDYAVEGSGSAKIGKDNLSVRLLVCYNIAWISTRTLRPPFMKFLNIICFSVRCLRDRLL